MITVARTVQPYPDHPDRLIIGLRCYVGRVCVDAVTGRMSGVEIMVCVYQCHIRASAGREGVKSVGLDIMISPEFVLLSLQLLIQTQLHTDCSLCRVHQQ